MNRGYIGRMLCKRLLDVSSNRSSFIPRVILTTGFHTTPSRLLPNPMIPILIKTIGKFTAPLVGRYIGKSIKKHSDPKTHRRNVFYMFSAVIGGTLTYAAVNYYTHRNTAPVTGRVRYIAYTNDQFKEISKIESASILEEYGNKVMPIDSKEFKRTARVIEQIINKNQDIDFFKNQSWSITLVDNETCNAMVLPTGDIVVLKGLLNMAQNDDQVAVVLAHELAHVYLSHGAEKVSVIGLVDTFVILITLGIWTFAPGDLAAGLMHFLYNQISQVLLHLPYSRKLEEEADLVGLQLMAKACYDVREASNFWRLMDTNRILSDDTLSHELLSTHPHNMSRSNRLDDLTYQALKTRAECDCKNLTREDPRVHGKYLHNYAILQQENKRLEEEKVRSVS